MKPECRFVSLQVTNRNKIAEVRSNYILWKNPVCKKVTVTHQIVVANPTNWWEGQAKDVQETNIPSWSKSNVLVKDSQTTILSKDHQIRITTRQLQWKWPSMHNTLSKRWANTLHPMRNKDQLSSKRTVGRCYVIGHNAIQCSQTWKCRPDAGENNHNSHQKEMW